MAATAIASFLHLCTHEAMNVYVKALKRCFIYSMLANQLSCLLQKPNSIPLHDHTRDRPAGLASDLQINRHQANLYHIIALHVVFE